MNRVYYLQSLPPALFQPARKVIDTDQWEGAYQIDSCLAEDWMSAKEKLGYPLSYVQQWLRENFR